MSIVGLGEKTVGELVEEVNNGAKFVVYQYCISILIMSFKQPSSVHYVPPGQGRVGKGIPFTLLAMVLGPWGFPFGIIWTIESMIVNLGGGRDVTNEMMNSILSSVQAEAGGEAQPEPHPFKKVSYNER